MGSPDWGSARASIIVTVRVREHTTHDLETRSLH